MIVNQVTTLKGTFIICKRVKKVPFYFRGDNYQKTSTTARHALRFDNKDAATAKCKEMNDKRKGGHKFRVEDADKHFINNFHLSYDTWKNELVIRNEFIAIQRATTHKMKINHSVNGAKASAIELINKRLAAEKQDVERAEAEYKQRLQVYTDRVNKFKQQIEFVTATDFDRDYVEPVLTKTDKTMSVLYGVKTQE